MKRSAFLALIFSGCTTVSSTPMFDQAKLAPLHLSVSTDPAPDAQGEIVRDAVLLINFDDFPDPDTVAFGPVLLRSGTSSFDAEMSVDLVGRAIRVKPRSLLSPGTQYELVMSTDLRSLSGRKLDTAMIAPIAVGSDLNPSPSPSPAALTWDHDVEPLLATCAPYCHTRDRCPGRMPPTRNPSRDLDLSGDPDDPIYGLINVQSVGLAGTESPLLRVQPGDSARSMLVRKLLGGNPHADSLDPPTANLKVPGRRMPLYESPCGEALPPPDQVYFDDARIRLIQDWIDQGATVH